MKPSRRPNSWMRFRLFMSVLLLSIHYGAGRGITKAQAAMQTPKALLHDTIAAGMAAPHVGTPKVNPAAA